MLKYPHIDPVLFHVGLITIRWYALAYIVGVLFGWWRLRKVEKKYALSYGASFWDDLLFYTILGVLLGGRLGYIFFYNFSFFIHHPLEIFSVWKGGMSFHGGFIGVAVASWYVCRRYKKRLLELWDLLATVAPIGLLLGRMANFVNGELWGRPTDVPWGMIFPRGGFVVRHPSQLYEAFFEGIVLFLFLQWFYQSGCVRQKQGATCGAFLLGYGLFRFSLEFFRAPDVQLGFFFGWISMGQLLSIPMIIGGLFFLKRGTSNNN